MQTTSVIELNKAALKNNLDFINNLLGNTKITSVVKGNAYGHGVNQFVPIAEEMGVNHFSVFSADEAKIVLKIKKPETKLMIMGWLAFSDMEWAIRNDIEFFVFDLETIYEVIIVSQKIKKPAKIHIEIETGMNRTGFVHTSLSKLVELIINHTKCFEICGLCTHYAGAESIANHVRIQRQIQKFKRTEKLLKLNGIIPEIRHTACSAASINYPKTRMDMVRLGIMQYGFWPNSETFIQYVHQKKDKTDPLRRVLKWKSQIMSVKQVKAGEFISYGINYQAQEDKKIAIIPVGYAQGYSRILSNQGRVLINGQFVNVIGLVNMNMIIADVTTLPMVNINDEVVLIGNQGEHEITVKSFSQMSDLMNYELLTRLPHNINRVVVNN